VLLVFLNICAMLPLFAMIKLRKVYHHDRRFVAEMNKGISLLKWFIIADAVFILAVYL
jgi:hypothetical protein